MLHYHNFEQKQEIEIFKKQLDFEFPYLEYQLCITTESHNNNKLNERIQIAVIVPENSFSACKKELLPFLKKYRSETIFYFVSSDAVKDLDDDIRGGIFL